MLRTNRIVVIIDDDDDDREVLETQLKIIDNSIQVFHARDGQDGLETLNNKMMIEPDLIFLDINMPIMDGNQFLKEIKKSRFRQIPVVIYSTSRSQEDVDGTGKLGAAFYLPKPDNLRELGRSLTGILARLFPPW